jgi:hypothetical protein
VEIVVRVVSGCFSLLVAVVFLIGFAAFVSDRMAVHRFRRQYGGKYVLVCTARHGWHDFIANNVVPVLPENAAVQWTRAGRGPSLVLVAVRVARVSGKLPLLVHVGKRIRSVSLNEQLLPLRSMAKRDAETQRRVAAIVAAAQREIAD